MVWPPPFKPANEGRVERISAPRDGRPAALDRMFGWVMVIGFLLWLPMMAGAATSNPRSPEDPQPSDPTDDIILADRLHQGVSRGVLKAAETIDGFFYAPQTEIEENRTTFKLKLDLFAEEDEDVELGTGSSLKLVLPGLQDRVHLVLAGDPEDDAEIFGEGIDTLPPGVAEEADTDGISAALRYFALDDLKNNLSFSAGVRIRDYQLVGFPEVRYRRALDLNPLALRFEQRLLWFTDEGWKETSSIDVDLLLRQRYLWRTTLAGTWTEERQGYQYALRFTLFQPLGRRSALRYEWINNFDVCRSNHLEEIVFKIRYRRNFWRPWLFFEVAPQLALPEADDFAATPGLLFRLEAIFGHYSKAIAGG